MNKKLEFNSGPFANFIGEVIEIQKKIKLLVKIMSINSGKTLYINIDKKDMIEKVKTLILPSAELCLKTIKLLQIIRK